MSIQYNCLLLFLLPSLLCLVAFISFWMTWNAPFIFFFFNFGSIKLQAVVHSPTHVCVCVCLKRMQMKFISPTPTWNGVRSSSSLRSSSSFTPSYCSKESIKVSTRSTNVSVGCNFERRRVSVRIGFSPSPFFSLLLLLTHNTHTHCCAVLLCVCVCKGWK